MVPQGRMKRTAVVSAYEGIATSISVWPCGLQGRAQNRQGDVGPCLI